MTWIEQEHFIARLECLLDDERCPYDLTFALLKSEVQRARDAMSQARDNALFAGKEIHREADGEILFA